MTTTAVTQERTDTVVRIALRASTLGERATFLAGRTAPDSTGLGRWDRWVVERAAERIAEQRTQESQRHPTAYGAGDSDRVQETLAAFALVDAAALNAEDRSRLLALHDAWLPTYTAAMSERPASADDAWWQAADVRYDRAAIACEPFLRLLAESLDGAEPAIARAAQENLLDRFGLALTWSIEVTAKVYCARHGIDVESATSAEYVAFLEDTFVDHAAHHAFHLQFPTLARWLAQITRQLADSATELGDRLTADLAWVGTQLFGQQITGVDGVRFGRGDPHAGGRSVARVRVVLADGGLGELMYKPRCVQAEAGLQRLTDHLAGAGVVEFGRRTVLARDGYGWEECVPTDCNAVPDVAAASRVYRELGGHLAVFYVLGGGDLHLENIVVADGHAHVCDAETVLRVVRDGERRPLGSLLDSVFNTGMLEWPQSGADGDSEMRISGYHGGETYRLPIPVPRVATESRRFGMRVRYRDDVIVTPDGANRVRLDGALVDPRAFADDVIRGFELVYDWFMEHPEEAAAAIGAVFGRARVRMLNWSTAVYSQLLAAVSHPRALMDPLECDLVFGRLRVLPSKHAEDRALVEHEIAALWRWDVPMFGASAVGTTLTRDDGHPVPTRLASSPVDHALERMAALTAQNRDQQTAYIAASLTSDSDDEAFRTACLDHAEGLAAQLCRTSDLPTREFRGSPTG